MMNQGKNDGNKKVKEMEEADKKRLEELQIKYEDWPRRGIEEPHENDVMYGRGGGTNHHPGNKRYRKIVEDHKVKYVNSRRLQKPLVALDIIRQWRAQSPPGRFLKYDEKAGLWNDVGDKKAREKTSQALREKAPQIRMQQEALQAENKKTRAGKGKKANNENQGEDEADTDEPRIFMGKDIIKSIDIVDDIIWQDIFKKEGGEFSPDSSESELDPREQVLALALERENSVGPMEYGTGPDGKTMSDLFSNKGRYESLMRENSVLTIGSMETSNSSPSLHRSGGTNDKMIELGSNLEPKVPLPARRENSVGSTSLMDVDFTKSGGIDFQDVFKGNGRNDIRFENGLRMENSLEPFAGRANSMRTIDSIPYGGTTSIGGAQSLTRGLEHYLYDQILEPRPIAFEDLPSRSKVKRNTSNQNEKSPSRTVKRASLNRDQSATSNRLKEKYMPKALDLDRLESLRLSSIGSKEDNSTRSTALDSLYMGPALSMLGQPSRQEYTNRSTTEKEPEPTESSHYERMSESAPF